jgi:ribonucleoside-diphosphate reductase alpha chain
MITYEKASSKGRRGALIITINDTHPDLLNFINIKNNLDKITKANISIKLTNKFFEACELFSL